MKKILSVLLPIILLLTPNLTVFASDTIINSDGPQAVPVTADVVATFEITVPSAIHITDFGMTEFLIKGTGNISKYEYLSIDIPSTVNMTCVGEYSENLPIIKSSDRFLREQLMSDEGSTITCSIDSSTLPSGSWIGSLDIYISVEDLYYRIPDTITYNFTYTTVVKNISDGSVILYDHAKPLYFHGAKGDYTKGTINTQNSSAVTWFYSYTKNSEGVWEFIEKDSFSTSSTGERIDLKQYEILYCNYDIYHGSTGELWQTKMCPD